MRREEKKNALELTATLEEAHHIIWRIALEGKTEQAMGLLEQCQEGAVALGELIEAKEPEQGEIVRLLEDYCEQVYQMYGRLGQKGAVKEESKAQQELLESVRTVREKIEQGISTRLEVVFLPYQASMWDSMESVWKAAKEDPDCDAYVIPIPYFDRKRDGSLGEEHYEWNQYPSYVPVVSYLDYDMESRRPDIIFIHNPYDEFNYVTSVHPDFYARRLQKYTGELAYIPYFVSKAGADYAALGKESMCASSGVRFSNHVFLQSQQTKSAYIKAIQKADQGRHLFGDLEEKLQPLGSPKFDKVREGKKEDYPLPPEWEKRLMGKEAVLYNTTVSPLLSYGEAYLEKIKKVFRLFSEREDIVLWWRPHPLLEQTIVSMRPKLWKEYDRIRNEFREREIGIYDDTSQMNRAVAWSSRYYGDRSSLATLFGATGKPVLISSVHSKKRVEREIEGWRTSDVEPDDLADWLDGREKWVLKQSFQDAYGLPDGNSGKRIYDFCKRVVES